MRWEYLESGPDDDEVTREENQKLKETARKIVNNEEVSAKEVDDLRVMLDGGGEIDWMSTYGATKDGQPLDFDPVAIGVDIDLMRSHNNRSTPERTDGHVKMTKYIVQREYSNLFTSNTETE